MQPHQRRALAIAIPLFTVFLLWGIIEAIFGIKADENLLQTGITLQTIFGFLNVVLVYWVWKHRVP